MKQASRLFLGAIGILLFSCSAALAYWAAAPELIGPKAEIVQFCSLLKPNMPATVIGAAVEQNSEVTLTPPHEGTQYVSQAKSGWLCTCGVHVDQGRINQVDGVICVD